MLKIFWSIDAKEDYKKNIDYLLNEWSITEAQNFIDEVDHILELLLIFPRMFPLTKYKGVRKGIICKQISILYRISKNRIELVRFWNNMQDIKKIKL